MPQAYLHYGCSPPIVHQDISSNNILLDSEFEACVSNFGTAKLLNPDSSNWTALAGTYGYIAPGTQKFLCAFFSIVFRLQFGFASPANIFDK